MKRLAKIFAVAMAVAMLFALAACGQQGESQSGSTDTESAAPTEEATDNGAAAKEGQYHIGIVQLVEHNALDKATEGFEDALKEKLGEDAVVFDYQNAQGEANNCTTISTKFVNDNVDLIMANATPAAQAAAQATGTIPIVGVSITDYEVAGLVESNEAPGRNVTGCSDLSPINEHVKLIQQLCPDAKNIGILYCSSEDNSIVQAKQAREAMEAAGYTVTDYTAADSNELQTVVTKACSEQDALYVPTDNLMAANMQIIKNVATPAGIPTFCGEENMINSGGFATYSVNYYTLGYNAGLMAYDVLANGKNPAEMPIQFMAADELTLVINQEVADQLGITIPEDLAAQLGQ
ncbi:MAG: ABC transporter substrate-binding protein [Oscillospiraceae bacterium]|nr:ABC transporter substrate-binding protein [Oscillospiraceae bacterium]